MELTIDNGVNGHVEAELTS